MNSSPPRPTLTVPWWFPLQGVWVAGEIVVDEIRRRLTGGRR